MSKTKILFSQFSILIWLSLSASSYAADKFYYMNPLANSPSDILLLKQNASEGQQRFQASNFLALRTKPLLAETTICFQSQNKKSQALKLNLTQGSSNRVTFIENGKCTTVDKSWNSYDNILSSFIKKFSGILSEDAVNDTFTAAYSVGSNRDSHSASATMSNMSKPFCLDSYSGKSEIQPGFYSALHIPFKIQYDGATAVLNTVPVSSVKQSQTITNGEAVFTDVDIKNGLTYAITIEQAAPANQTPLILRTLDIDRIRMQQNDEGIPVFDKKALSGNVNDNYDDEFANILYDLKLLTDAELAYFHIHAINDLYKKAGYSNELFIKAVLPKIDSYKQSYCRSSGE